MKLRIRLQRLERSTVDLGCPACRDRRGRIVLVTAQRLRDGTVVAIEEEPQPCARGRQVPEQIIEVVETVVDEPTSAAESEVST